MNTTDQKIALLTGGSSGIGRHAAIRIAERGNGVILTYNLGPERALETVAAIEQAGGTAVALQLDGLVLRDTVPQLRSVHQPRAGRRERGDATSSSSSPTSARSSPHCSRTSARGSPASTSKRPAGSSCDR